MPEYPHGPAVSVVTDSCASIPEALIRQLGIEVVPYYIHVGRKTLRDLVDVQRPEFFEWLGQAKELPKTANPGAGDFLEAYQRLANSGTQDIVSIHMTSWGSGAYQAATLAKHMLARSHPRVRLEVIDSRQTSLCYLWMAIEAARAARDGQNLDDIVQLVKGMIPRTQMIQTADTLKYLYMGGRIGRAQHLLGSLLNIKPLIGMGEGVIVPLGRARSRRGAYHQVVAMMETSVGQGVGVKVAFVHAAALDEAQTLRALVEERMTCVEVLMAGLSPALGVHTGPGTVGVCYYPVDMPKGREGMARKGQ